jgi:ABC-type antimicrobial peptide transport system permease subunit
MFGNYLKIALRGLIKNRSYTIINILGLGIGMAVALIIGLWAHYEYSYDRFLPNYEKAYQVKRHYTIDGEVHTIDYIAMPLEEVIRQDIPGVQHVALTDWGGSSYSLIVDDTKLSSRGLYGGKDFLQIFQFPLLRGDRETALSQPNSIVLTRSTAEALFETEDVIGKTVRFENSQDLQVTAVLEDLPGNSTFQFSHLTPMSLLEQINPYVQQVKNEWLSNSFKLYLSLESQVSKEQVEPSISPILAEKSDDLKPYDPRLSLQSLADWHLYGEYRNGEAAGGYIEYVRLFSWIGLLVLLLACINFMNLATAGSARRAKEIGVRKAIGSKRRHLITQFLSESLLLTIFSFGLALLIVKLALPTFNALLNSQLHIPFEQPLFWLLMLLYIGITALLAGSRPAFYLSSFNANQVLKGGSQFKTSAAWGRKSLVLLQFSCSIALIICTITIFRQVQYVQERPTGYEQHGLLMTNMSDDLNRNYEAVRNELLQSGVVEQVTRSSGHATDINFYTLVSDWPGKTRTGSQEIGAVTATDTYFETLGMKIVAGRNFQANLLADSSSVILNETLVKSLGLSHPIGQQITWNRDQKVTIVGVVKDAILLSPYTPIHPTLFFPARGSESSIMYRLSSGTTPQTALPQIEKIFNRHNPAYPFNYEFADDAYARKFQLEVMIGKLAALFAGLAIFVSCLGLFGLAAYMVEQRRKEIGIRKVLGATVSQIWVLLSGEFILLVLLSCVIATPLALYFLRDWLAQYDYRISLGPITFLLAGALALLITLITISFQAVRAALAQPVHSLRSE